MLHNEQIVQTNNGIGRLNYFHKLTSPYNKVCNFYNTDTHVMILAIQSHANAKLIQSARCKFKVSWVKFVGIRPT